LSEILQLRYYHDAGEVKAILVMLIDRYFRRFVPLLSLLLQLKIASEGAPRDERVSSEFALR